MFVRQRQLDFLRGFAATYVVVNHARGALFVGGDKLLAVDRSPAAYLAVGALQLTSLGAEMVILFFVLSGFAMAHSIAHTSSVRRFYLRRLIRIWPPYIAATILAFLVARLVGGSFDLAKTLFYLDAPASTAPQFWSLPYEVAFYCLCPVILAPRVSWLLPLAAVATFASLLIKGPLLNPWHVFPLDFFGCELILFAIGAWAYRNYERLPVVRLRYILPLLLAAVWAAKMMLGGSNMVSTLLMALIAVLTIRNLPEHIPNWANFGRFSYSIYIYHYALLVLIVWLFSRHGINLSLSTNPVMWMLAVPPIVGACYLLYLVSERPCNLVVAGLREGKRSTRPAGDVAPAL